MQARTRQLANLLLASFLTLSCQYPSDAQYLRYSTARYPKVLSAVEDSSGNFLLLNLQSKANLPAPSIQYLPGSDGKTIMVADFHGLVWNEESKIMRTQCDLIESVRLGQFQDNPPIFRISITTSNPQSLRKLEFRCQSKALLIKYPPAFAGNLDEPRPAPAFKKQKQKAQAQPVVASNKVEQRIPPAIQPVIRPDIQPVITKSAVAAKTVAPLRRTESRQLNTDSPPFKSGGLYLQLGPDPAAAENKPVELASASYSTDSKQPLRVKTLPPLAPEIKQKNDRDEKMPPTAPSVVAESNDDLPAAAPEKKHSANSTGLLKKLLHKLENTAETPAVPAAPAAVAAKETKTAEDSSANKASADAVPLADVNPKLEFSGKDPYKVKLKFDSEFKYKSFKLDSPPRYVVDIENARTAFNPLLEPDKNPWLKSVRFGNPEENLTRIVFDLAQDHVQVKEDLDSRGQILQLTLSEEAAEAQTQSKTSIKNREVVLDAGHGGSDPGAQRGDIQEKEITLAITQKLKQYLQDHGVRVIMTRSDDTFVSLEDRARLTNTTHPDAFVSIHINSLETDRDIKGIETYYQTEQSRTLAEKVHAQLVDKLQVPDRSVRKARFYVVNHTDRPAILAEVGFISNKDERDKLISSDYQAKVAESVGQGVILYLAGNSVPGNSGTESAQSASNQQASKKRATLASYGQSAVKQ